MLISLDFNISHNLNSMSLAKQSWWNLFTGLLLSCVLKRAQCADCAGTWPNIISVFSVLQMLYNVTLPLLDTWMACHNKPLFYSVLNFFLTANLELQEAKFTICLNCFVFSCNKRVYSALVSVLLLALLCTFQHLKTHLLTISIGNQQYSSYIQSMTKRLKTVITVFPLQVCYQVLIPRFS